MKELRETNAALKLIKRVNLSSKPDLYVKAQKECIELISIFVKSVETAKRNNIKNKEEMNRVMRLVEKTKWAILPFDEFKRLFDIVLSKDRRELKAKRMINRLKQVKCQEKQ